MQANVGRTSRDTEPKQMDATPLHHFAELNKVKNDSNQR